MTPEAKQKLSSAFAEAYNNAENEIEKNVISRQASEWGLTIRIGAADIFEELANYFNPRR